MERRNRFPPLPYDYKFWEPPGAAERRAAEMEREYQEAERVFAEHKKKVAADGFRQYTHNHMVKSDLRGQESVFGYA